VLRSPRNLLILGTIRATVASSRCAAQRFVRYAHRSTVAAPPLDYAKMTSDSPRLSVLPDSQPTLAGSFVFVAPRHPDGSDWPWLSRIGPMQRHSWSAIYIENTWKRWERASKPYVRWQYARAMRRIARADVAFFFSTDINVGMTRWPSRLFRLPRRIYVGFTQDGVWPQQKVGLLSHAMQQLDAVTVFSEDERQLYLQRFGLQAERTHLIPIHTDETGDYSQYPDALPADASVQRDGYVLSLGSPNRRFTPIARACQALKVPLVIITRPWHKNDSLDELARMGATIITNADKMKSLTYLRCARAAVMAFETDQLPGAFTTLIHGMFMRTPSVVTACLGMSDYVVNNDNGLIAPHGDEDALRRAIERLWSEDGLAERMGEAGYQRAQRLYSLEAAATRHEALARQVMEGNR
jgi:glycosyltransferase involved in cell wall biosynthesis